MRESMRFAVLSHTGLTRENNEDSLAYNVPEQVWPAIFVVADGMGGHLNGELASKVAAEYCRNRLAVDLGSKNEPARLEELLSDTIQKANIKVYLKSLEDDNNRGMGTTLTMSVFYPESAYIAHVGDSRCYLFRQGVLDLLSLDHTVVQEMLSAGTISDEESQNHPQRHVLTQALGAPEYLRPEILHLDVRKHDRFLLCSDGLHGFVDSFAIAEVLRMSADPESCCQSLIDLALKKGGHDNITVIVVFL